MTIHKTRIYFDHAATTPIDKEVLESMMPFLTSEFGNASSVHWFGQTAAVAVEKARRQAADALNCRANEIYFTSGATESNNTVIKGLAQPGQHIIVSQIEHPSILEPAKIMERWGIEVTYLPPDSNGLVSVEAVSRAVKDSTVLVSVMYVNNEIGTVQPIAEIGRLIRELNQSRKQRIFFHTDAVQAANYCELDVEALGVDLLSLSGHKVYGPKGIGLLYRKAEVPLQSLLSGGGQEYGFRSGTLNVPAIVGFGRALELASKNRISDTKKILELRDYLINLILKKVPQARLNGDSEHRVANNANVLFPESEGETVLMLLDQAGFAVSSGSACSSGSLDPSHVLLALGLDATAAKASVRFSLGRGNNKKQIDNLILALLEALQK
ncbi:MAG: cysteine desulfurase [Candidatus Buchananbacteria bacterium]|nr:cysteine desulfurase [Candidatus Buchananbacteria bacterium]